ncbi:MAG: hypothetical protein ABIG32_00465 [Candidatus Uhrbacteria bacterium]|nr:hypothetical protein [Patescibacteria group bacterium]MBU1907328.1 hypothetical protein [Patescibacteria group bacterium]
MEKETTTNKIMVFLQEHMVTKEEFSMELKNVRKEIKKTEHRILDIMDKKLSSLKGDLIVLMKKADQRVSELISVLRDKPVLIKEETEHLSTLSPFPKTN